MAIQTITTKKTKVRVKKDTPEYVRCGRCHGLGYIVKKK